MGRIAHKIKGAAATVGYDVLALLAHTFEDMLQTVYLRRAPATERAMTLLHRCVTLLDTSLESARHDVAADPLLPAQATHLLDELQTGDDAPDVVSPQSGSWGVQPDVEGITARHSVAQAGGESSLRIDVRRLDDLMTRISVLATSRATLARIHDDIEHFHQEMDSALGRLRTASARVGDWQPIVQALATPPGAERSLFAADPRRAPAEDRASMSGERSIPPTGASGWARADPAEQSRARGSASLDLERYSELDQALRALAEAVNDATSSSASLRALLARFSRLPRRSRR